MRTIKDFKGIHQGETAWMFGKGPSLNDFDFSKAGPIRCAINDVAGIVPNCKYAFANDRCDDPNEGWADVYQHQTILFSPRRTYKDPFLKASPVKACEHVIYDDIHDTTKRDSLKMATPQSLIDNGLIIRRGTLGSALQVLWIMGVTKIICVGIDGGGIHSNRAQWRTRLRNLHFIDYNAIRDAFIEAAGWLAVDLEFHGSKLLMRNGKMKIKIIKRTFVGEGVGYPGNEYEVVPGEGEQLIAAGKAIRVVDPVVVPPPIRVETQIEVPEERSEPVETPEPIKQPARKRARKRTARKAAVK